MKKFILLMIAILCTAFLVTGCRPGGQAIAGQMAPEPFALDSMRAAYEKELEKQPYNIGEVAPETHPTHVGEPIAETAPVDFGATLDCMVGEVTISPSFVVSGATAPTEEKAKETCISAMAQLLWEAANEKCMKFKKEDKQTQCRVSSGTLNPDKDITVTKCGSTSYGWIDCTCELNKDKDYICNSH